MSPLNQCSTQTTRLSVKGCEVCGGTVRPLDDRSVFGYCEKCGLVYALTDRLIGGWGTEGASGVEAVTKSESLETKMSREASRADAALGSYWRCPDCDAEIRMDSDSDLEFAKREHLREYHPNRSTG